VSNLLRRVQWQSLSGFRDTIGRLAILDEALKAVGCDEIFGLVVYDLPGRDCAAKASNGELPVGSLSRYKSEYIDGKLFFANQRTKNRLSNDSHQEDHSGKLERRHCCRHRARFPPQLGHQRQPYHLPAIRLRLSRWCCICSQGAQPSQRCHVP
jgi:hypothetical protein